jgi:hypothetical protein
MTRLNAPSTPAARALEVSRSWGDDTLDTRQFPVGHTVTIGAALGHRWSLLGRPIGHVPGGMAGALSLSPPIWSTVQPVWTNDFYAASDGLPDGEEHALLRAEGSSWVARLDPAWDGFVDLGDERLGFAELVARGVAQEVDGLLEITLTDDMSLAVEVGGVVFSARRVRPTAAPRVAAERDYGLIGMASACSFLFVMFGLLMQHAPVRPEAQIMAPEERLVETKLQVVELPVVELEQKEVAREPGGGGPKRAKAAGGGDDRSPKAAPRTEDRGPGCVGLMCAFAGVDGPLNNNLNPSLVNGVAGLIGTNGTHLGSSGLGPRFGGLGGPGAAAGPGGPKGTGGPGRDLAGGGDLGAKKAGRVTTTSTEPLVLGGLDRALVDSVIKRKISQIKYCFDRELQKDPSLGGKLTIRFTIAKDGSVSQARTHSSTVGSPAVEACVTQRFYQMAFPEPKGGGIVEVRYPFIFSGG